MFSNNNEMILNRKIENEVSFKYNAKEQPLSKKLRLLRFQVNPTKYWGPLSLPKGDSVKIDKRALNQNKRKRKLEDEDNNKNS